MRNFLILILLPFNIYSQINTDLIPQQEFDKTQAQFLGKKYIYEKILEHKDEITPFVADPLSAAQSGQIVTIYYNSPNQNKEGLVIGFFGNYVSQEGVPFKGYSFKNLNKSDALNFINKVQSAIDSNEKYLKSNKDNNIGFTFQDMTIIISTSSQTAYEIRMFWKGFDSTMDAFTFSRTKNRFNYNLKNKN